MDYVKLREVRVVEREDLRKKEKKIVEDGY